MDFNRHVNDAGRLDSVNNGAGNSTQYTFDANHNLLTSTAENGIFTSYTYPTSGNRGLPTSISTISQCQLYYSSTSIEYQNNYNYIKKVTDARGKSTQYEYDNGATTPLKGLITKITDANGNDTQYTYNANNDARLSISGNADASTPVTGNYTYDAQNRLSSISHNDVTCGITYDTFGRISQVNMGTQAISTLAYNSDGTLYTNTYGNGNVARFGYDNLDRVLFEHYNNTLTYEYTYNGEGQVGRHNDYENGVSWIYQYDLAGRMISSTGNNNTRLSYTYDDRSNLSGYKAMKDSTVLSKVDYTYDNANRPLDSTISSMANAPKFHNVYDKLSRFVFEQNTYDSSNTNNYVQKQMSYILNGSNRTGVINWISHVRTVGTVKNDIYPKLQYTYDNNGNVITVSENSVLKATYVYDGLNRLIRENNVWLNKTIVYAYDNGGNITSKNEYAYTTDTLGSVVDTVNYAYGDSNWKDKMTSFDGTDITYDAIGNPLTYRGFTFTWKKGRQLATASGNGVSAVYKYNSSGLRTQKTLSGTATNYIYSGDRLVSQTTGSTTLNFAYSHSGAPLGFTYGGQNYFYIKNLQGDIVGIYDGSGTTVVQYQYDSWGKLVSITGSLASTVGVANPLRYRGYYYDTETGLYYLQSRYYDPETCRFINADEIVVSDDSVMGMNMFAYCLGNPIMYSDPTGYASNSYSPALVDLMSIVLGAGIIATVLPEDQAIAFAQALVDIGASAAEVLAAALSLLSDDCLYAGLPPVPDHPNFIPPKKGTRWVNNPNGEKSGWLAKDGGVWVWTPGMDGGDGWTIQYPGGSHSHAYPGGGTRTHKSSITNGILIGAGVVATVVILLDNATGAGVADDPLIPAIWTAILA